MFEDYKICPYTGLRPFTEEESIYFKGRDEHIEQATRQLEKNKFIMLTGASGDGKSSLVYAGIVPNAKAGFLKASFSNWAIVDFRPERSPMTNLTKALASQLNINADTVRTELGYGFSALVDIYKASSLYYDTKSAEWNEGDDRARNERKRKAANLIILADQFEEFFTNPENFEKGVPSQEAMSVTNLLLETARIALEENLPIYVVITMRSDFIGQCAAFRGLPEHIGFSQFFVPRLNRKELSEVIEEPAVLSGNTIERRLTERLIHDIVEGTDQLPILQHALNQIWKMADEGQSSMDLIHYAMVGGMRGSELPAADVAKFNAWFATLPPNVQKCYDQPDLQNVLNTHADKLFIQDADHLKIANKGDISDDDAKLIIKTAFKCLTKINNGRAVRNRMTLAEITAIINVPHLDHKIVGKTLDIFREPGNTLLRPFSEEMPELGEDDVLDITHESLIRNWEHLEQWAIEEFNSFTISRDFGQQLNRWIDSGKSNDFLLYIGPLTYFETWIKDEKPNAAWIARYLKGDQNKAAKLAKADAIQNDATAFLKRSASKHRITRFVVRYGAGRIAAVFGLIALLILSFFLLRNYWERQDAYVLKKLSKTSLEYSRDKEILLPIRGRMLAEEIFAGVLTIPDVVQNAQTLDEKTELAIAISTQLVYQGTNEPAREILQSLHITDSLLRSYPATASENGKQASTIVKLITDHQDILELAYFYKQSPEIKALRDANVKRAGNFALQVFRNKPPKFTNIENLNRTLEIGLNGGLLTVQELDELIGSLSPFDNKNVSPWISDNFAKDKVATKGFFDTGFSFNGLYQELAYLYGAKGNATLALKCIDSLLVYNAHYHQSDYNQSVDNAGHIASSFFQYKNLSQLDVFVAGYCDRAKISPVDFYDRLMARCKLYEFATTVTWQDPAYDLSLNLSLEYSSDEQLDFFFDRFRNAINTTEKDLQQRNFMLALSYKNQGIIHLRKLEVSGTEQGKEKYLALFDKAVDLYRSLDSKFLNTNIQVIDITGDDALTIARKFLFLHPDIRTPFHPNESRLYHYAFTTGAFLDYILSRNLFSEFYATDSDLRILEIFMRDYHFVETDIAYTASKRMSYELMKNFEKNLTTIDGSGKGNFQLLYLYLGHLAASRNDEKQMMYYYSHLDPGKSNALFINSFNPGFAAMLLAKSVGDFAKFNHFDESKRIAHFAKGSLNRSSIYAYAATDLILNGIKDQRADRLIDSARAELLRMSGNNAVQTNRVQIAIALSYRDKPNDLPVAERLIKNVEIKNFGVGSMARAVSSNKHLYDASRYMSDNNSASDNAFLVYDIAMGYGRSKSNDERMKPWRLFQQNRSFNYYRPIAYADENN